jgi:hypothetical protein
MLTILGVYSSFLFSLFTLTEFLGSINLVSMQSLFNMQ